MFDIWCSVCDSTAGPQKNTPTLLDIKEWKVFSLISDPEANLPKTSFLAEKPENLVKFILKSPRLIVSFSQETNKISRCTFATSQFLTISIYVRKIFQNELAVFVSAKFKNWPSTKVYVHGITKFSKFLIFHHILF